MRTLPASLALAIICGATRDTTGAIGDAGEWDVIVTLNNEPVTSQPVDMWCPEAFYEEEDSSGFTSCHACGVGA